MTLWACRGGEPRILGVTRHGPKVCRACGQPVRSDGQPEGPCPLQTGLFGGQPLPVPKKED